jgi:hypothetical protein
MLGAPAAGALDQTHWNPLVPLAESQVTVKSVSLPTRDTVTSADWTKPGRADAVEE